jgi:hypothetical protein
MYGILLGFHSTLVYFARFQFRFGSFQKFKTIFGSLSKWFKISKFRTWQWRKLKKLISHILTRDKQLNLFAIFVGDEEKSLPKWSTIRDLTNSRLGGRC